MALQKLGKYEIVTEIGRGAMGVVYKAFDPILEREVALKTMMTSMSSLDVESKARFYREARSAARLTHRNIVTIFDMGEDQGIPFIAMEYLDGVDLHRKMKKEGPLPLREALEISSQVLRGLHYAHQYQIVHRDIKPANIYILRNGTAKILDFGIAKLASSEMTRTGMVLGTVDYMSPEQIRADKGVDGRSDLFSVGVILYELIAGQKPFPGETITQIMFKIVHDPPQPISGEREVPEKLIEISARSLDKEPSRRFQNGEEFAKDLDQVIHQIDAELTTVRQIAPSGVGAREGVTLARRLFEGGSFVESAKLLKVVLDKDPGHKEATELLTLVDRRMGADMTVQFEAEPEPPRPSAPRGSRIEQILAEIEEERKTSPGAAGRSEKGVPDLTMRLDDSGVNEAPPAVAPPAPPPPTAPRVEPKATTPPSPPSYPSAAKTVPPPSRTAAPASAEKPFPTAKTAPPAAPATRPSEKIESKPKPPAEMPTPAKKEARPAEPSAKGKAAERSTDELFPPEPKPQPRPASRFERPARPEKERIARPEKEIGPAVVPPSPKKGISPMLIGGGVAAVLIVAVGGYLIFGRGSRTAPSTPGGSVSPSKEASKQPGPATSPSKSAPSQPVAGAAGYLSVDAIPWAEITAISDGATGKAVQIPSEAGGGPTTPIVIDLPAGRYEITLKHPDYPEMILRDVVVTSGQWTRVNPGVPGFKPKIPSASPQ